MQQNMERKTALGQQKTIVKFDRGRHIRYDANTNERLNIAHAGENKANGKQKGNNAKGREWRAGNRHDVKAQETI